LEKVVPFDEYSKPVKEAKEILLVKFCPKMVNVWGVEATPEQALKAVRLPATLILGASITSKVNEEDVEQPAEVFAVTVYRVELDVALGVPEITPVEVLKLSPDDNPGLIVKPLTTAPEEDGDKFVIAIVFRYT
jgi:hypothetical protein